MANNSLAAFSNKISSKGVKQSYMFQVLFTNLPNGVAGDELNSKGNGSDGFNLWVMASKLPGVKLTTNEIKRNNITVQLPSTVEPVQDWTCDVLLDMNMSIYSSLRKWVAYFSDLATGGAGARGVPTTNAYVDMLDAGGNAVANQRYVLRGIFPVDVPDIDLTHDNGDLVKLSVAWKFQYSYLASDGDPFSK